MTTVFIGVGSNLGDREDFIVQAKQRLFEHPAISDFQESALYETEPVGGPPQGDYLNQVWQCQTDLDCKELLFFLQSIEKALGRERRVKNGPRTIDLDLLFYGDQVIEKKDKLTVPHPRLHERFFVLRPLCDLNPSWVHPKFKKDMQTLLEELLASH